MKATRVALLALLGLFIGGLVGGVACHEPPVDLGPIGEPAFFDAMLRNGLAAMQTGFGVVVGAPIGLVVGLIGAVVLDGRRRLPPTGRQTNAQVRAELEAHGHSGAALDAMMLKLGRDLSL